MFEEIRFEKFANLCVASQQKAESKPEIFHERNVALDVVVERSSLFGDSDQYLIYLKRLSFSLFFKSYLEDHSNL